MDYQFPKLESSKPSLYPLDWITLYHWGLPYELMQNTRPTHGGFPGGEQTKMPEKNQATPAPDCCGNGCCDIAPTAQEQLAHRLEQGLDKTRWLNEQMNAVHQQMTDMQILHDLLPTKLSPDQERAISNIISKLPLL